MAITQEQVNKVCAELIEDNDAPTLAAVRAELGTGSMATIAKMVRTWRESQGTATRSDATAAAVDVPEVVQALAQKMAGAMWAEAERLAAARLSAERDAMAANVASVRAELETSYESLDVMQKRIDVLERQAEEAFEQFKKMRAEEAAMRQAVAMATNEATEAKAIVPHMKAYMDEAKKDAEHWRTHCELMATQITELAKIGQAQAPMKKTTPTKQAQKIKRVQDEPGEVDTRTTPLELKL